VTPLSSKLATGYRAALGIFLFVLVLIMYFGTNDPTIHIKELLTGWAALVLAGSYMVVTWIARIPLRRPPIFREVLLCLLGFFFVSSLFSEFRAISLLETARFFSLFALYWLASQVFHNTAQVTRFFALFCGAMTLAALYAILQFSGLDPFPWEDTTSDTYTNLPATFGNPNYAAHALILAIVMVIGLYRMGFRWTPWLLPFLFFHLYRTDQRAGWVALAGAAVLVAVGYALLRKPQRPAGAVLTTVSVVAVLGVVALAGAMVWTYTKSGYPFPLDLSLLLRYQSYVSATNMLLDAPVLGHGPAVYGIAYAPYWTPFEQDWFAQEIRMNGHVHNDLIEIGIDGGLAAAGLYLATLLLGICYSLLYVARGTTPQQRTMGFTLAGLFTAFAIDGLFGFNLRVPVTAALFFLLLGVLDGLWAAERDDEKRVPAWQGHGTRVVFLLLLLLGTRHITKDFTGDYHFYTGMRAHAAGELTAAREAYARAESAAPWNWHASRRIAMTLVDEGELAESRAHFNRSLEQNPYYLLTRLPMARASLLLAQQAMQQGADGVAQAKVYLDEARMHAQHFLDAAPRYPIAEETLGRVESIAAILERSFTPNGDPAVANAHWLAARNYLKQAIDHGAENAGDLYRMIARIESSLGDQAGTERALLGAVQADQGRDNRSWELFLAFARESGDFGPMRDALYRMIDELQLAQRDQENEEPVEGLAIAFDWLAAVQLEGYQDVASASEAYRASLNAGPMRPATWSRFAGFAYEHEQVATLKTFIQSNCTMLSAQEIEPLPQVAAVNAVLTGGVDQLDQASRVLLAGVRTHPADNPLQPQEVFGWAARMLHETYQEAAEAGSAPCESALNLGIVSAGIQEFGVADRLFQVAHVCLADERKAITAVHWADTMIRTGRLAEAVSLLEESEEDFPDHVDTQWALAKALGQSGRLEEARAKYDALLQSDALSDEGRARLQAERSALPTS